MSVAASERRRYARAPRWAADALFASVFVALSVLALRPLWIVHWLPGTDTGGHLELMEAARHLDDATSPFARTYRLAGWLQPNIFGIALSRWLSPWVSTLTVARCMLSFYVVGLPLGALSVARAFGRSRWLALLTFPVAFNYCLIMGLFNYVVAMPLVLWSVALAKAFADRPRHRLGVLLAALLGLTFFVHALAFLVAAAMAGYVILFGVEGWRRRALGLGYVALGGGLCALWALRKFAGISDASGPPMSYHAMGATRWPPAREVLGRLSEWLIDFSAGGREDLLMIVLAGCWIVLGLLSAPAAEPARGRRAWLRLPVLAAWVSLAYAVSPRVTSAAAPVAERFAFLALLLWALAPRVDPRRPLVGLALLVGVSAGAGVMVEAASSFQRFDDETARPLARALAELPRGRTMSYVKVAEGPTALRQQTTRHLPKGIWALQNGGVTDDSFAYRATCPLQYLPGQTPPRPDRHFWLHQQTYRRYDYVLYRASIAPPRRHLVGFARLVWHDRWWWLYEILGGERAEPAAAPAHAVDPPTKLHPSVNRAMPPAHILRLGDATRDAGAPDGRSRR